MVELQGNGLRYESVYDEETISYIKKEFSRTTGECYLDHAGATLYSDTQLKNISDELCKSIYANPHSVGVASVTTQNIIENMRYRILNHFHTSSNEYSIIFTSGATESLKIVAETFSFARNQSQMSGHFIYTQDNHTSVLGMREVVAGKGARILCLNHKDAFQILNHPSFDLNNKQVKESNSLFIYPGQCNFSGLKYPLQWIENVHSGALCRIAGDISSQWYVFLDAAAFVPTNDLDLSRFKPDFVCLSFYKMFGYPTGLGALLVKNSSANVLQKVYYGGGTVNVSLSSEMLHVKRQVLHQRFEDGTVPFLSIISLRHGLDILSKITMEKISQHVFFLAKYLQHSLLALKYHNGQSVVKLYSDSNYDNHNIQGGIVTFNVKRSNGEYVGYVELANMAALFKIHLRTGCFCNPGACQRHLSLSNKEILDNYDAGYICGGTTDLINGKPTGAVRISFGFMSTVEDAQTVLNMIITCFLNDPQHRKYSYNQIKHSTDNFTKKEDNITIANGGNNLQINPKHIFNDVKHFSKISRSYGTVKRLFIYPIKSCAYFEISTSWSLNTKGLEYDREWMIVTSAGTCLTQKDDLNLCLIKPILCKKKKVMTLTYPGMPPIDISLKHTVNNVTNATICQSKICGHRVEGIYCGSDVSEWLSLALCRPNLRLMRQNIFKTKDLKNDLNHADLSFSSQAQYLLINENSVSWLTDKVCNTSEFKKDTALHRFRANIILSGYNAFEETQWKTVYIGKSKFLVNGPCTRCQMICIDQISAVKTVEPLRTLAKEFHGKLRFGIYLTLQTIKKDILNIGDIVNCE